MKTEIDKYEPCKEGLRFRQQFNTFKEAWEKCYRGDWMLWIAAEMNVDSRTLTLAKGLCANTVMYLMEDDRSVEAVRAAIAYGKGEIDSDELARAADAAAAASDAADADTAYTAVDAACVAATNSASDAADAASDAADAASDAADAASDAADAACAYADAAYAAAAADAAYAAYTTATAYGAYTAAPAAAAAAAIYNAAAAADAEVAREDNQKQTADICREILTEAVFEKLNIKK